MEHLNPEKLTVEFGEAVTETEPIIGRKYTLTHSDTTAELFLSINIVFAYDKITRMRDEVLAEWRIYKGTYYLFVHLHVDGENDTETAVRNAIFRRELPLALEAIRYGDAAFFEEYPELDQSPIWVHFSSESADYDKSEIWGVPKDYK